MVETSFALPFELPFWLEFAATITGAISGGMSAVRARYDIFGTITIACVTGLGGGLIRDVLLQDYGIYAFQSPWLLISCAMAGVVVFYFGRLASYLDPAVELFDNISVALWAIIGASKSVSAGMGIIPSIVLGTITAIGGGITRDVLMNRSPVAFQTGTMYGSAAFIGCIIYCPMKTYGILPDSAGMICAGIILALRYLSLIMGWRTKPPRDYSDTVMDTVSRPMMFIARKMHVPVGKTARERQSGSKLHRVVYLSKRFYNRLTGHWMEEAIESSQTTVLMDKIETDQGSNINKHTHDSNHKHHAQHHELEEGADHSDRIFVDRDELYRIIGLDPHTSTSIPPITHDEKTSASNEPQASETPANTSEEDPFEPQTPEPAKKAVNNPREHKRVRVR